MIRPSVTSKRCAIRTFTPSVIHADPSTTTGSAFGPDWPRVFDEAARLDKAVEIDAYPDRQV